MKVSPPKKKQQLWFVPSFSVLKVMSNKLPNFNKKSPQPFETQQKQPTNVQKPASCNDPWAWLQVEHFFFAASVLLRYRGEINQKTNPKKTCKNRNSDGNCPSLPWFGHKQLLFFSGFRIGSLKSYRYDTCLPVQCLALESFLSISHLTVWSTADPTLHVRYLHGCDLQQFSNHMIQEMTLEKP